MSWRDWIPPVFFKASATTRAVVLMVTPGIPVGTPRNFEQLSKEGYEANVTVYACVNEYAKGIGSLAWCLYQTRRGKKTELERHELLSLLARPNAFEGGAFFFGKWAGYLLLSGNSYLERLVVGDGRAALTRPPKELHALRPDRMEVIPDLTGYVGGYRYTAGGNQVNFPAAQIHHSKLFFPTHDFYGLSPISVAARTIDTDNAAVLWNYALLKNSGRPSGALVVGKGLTDPQFKRLQTQLEVNVQGAERAGYPLLLEGGMDWKEMGINPKDMDFIEGRKMGKSDIALTFQVPGELIGLKESTYENRREARRAFWTQSLLPLATVLRDELNHWLVPLYGEDLYLDFDRDAIEALQEDRDKLWARIEKATWLTLNEKRAATGYDTHPDGDVLLVPFNAVPLAGAGDTGASYEQLTDQAESAADGPSAAKLLTDEPGRTMLWKGFIRQTASIEQEYQRALARYFKRQGEEVLARIEANPVAFGISAKAAVHDELLFELDAETGKLREVSKPYFQRAQRRGGDAVWLEAGAEGAFAPEALPARTRLEVQLEGVSSIVRHARERVKRAIEAGLNNPAGAEGVEAIAGRIREAYKGLSTGQALTIARTETARAYSEGRDEAMAQAGVEEMEWLSARDEDVRKAPFKHDIDGQVRRRGQPFSNGLLYPHDPNGEAGNVINCRCVALPVAKGRS